MELPKQQTLDYAIKLLGEFFVPGASLLMDGKIVSGSAHLIVGAWAKAAIGPVGAAVVVANSYAELATGKSLLKHLVSFAEQVQSGGAPPQYTTAEPRSGVGPGGASSHVADPLARSTRL